MSVSIVSTYEPNSLAGASETRSIPYWGIVLEMTHTVRDRTKLLHRVRRIRGQLEAVERALENDGNPFRILQTVAASRGALNSLIGEIIEGHVRLHLLDPTKPPTEEQREAAGELIDILRAFLR
jgi:DNA-binding FrmR family transcriptional regulator